MLTKITITVPDLGDNRKNLEVEGALAAGEKATVTLLGIPDGTSTDGTELRLRVLGPMGEDLATHGDWTVGEDGEYTTDLDLATLQAYRLFVPPPPPPPPPNLRPVPRGYHPVRPPFVGGADVRLLVELRTDGDASMLGMRTRPLAYWPTDWRTATLIDLADGRVYSKEEVDELLAQEASARASGDAAEAAARAAGDAETLSAAKAYADTKYAKPAGGIPKSDLDASVQASLSKADTALQSHQDISGKADLVGGKVPSSQLPSYVDDVLEYESRSAFPATGEEGKIYVAKDENKTYRWTGTQYVQVGGGGDAPVLSVNGKTGAVVISASDVGAAPASALSDYRTASAQDAIDGGKVDKSGDKMTGLLRMETAALPVYGGVNPAVVIGANGVSVAPSVNGAADERAGVRYMRDRIQVVPDILDDTSKYDVSFPDSAGKLALASQIPAAQVNADWNAQSGVAQILNKPALGTAAAKDVPASGNASSTQVVLGSDSRLSNARTPTAHTHASSDVSLPSGVQGSNLGAWISTADMFLGQLPSASDIITQDTNGDLHKGNPYPSDTKLTDAPKIGGTSLALASQIPTVPANVSAFANDAGYLTQHQDISGKLDANKRNLLAYTSGTTLAPETAVYRGNLANDGTFPTITDTAIPTAAAYYQFELELTVPSTVPSTITGPSGWTWLDGHGLPDPADLSGGETIYISVRLDCTARTFLASVWRVA